MKINTKQQKIVDQLNCKFPHIFTRWEKFSVSSETIFTKGINVGDLFLLTFDGKIFKKTKLGLPKIISLKEIEMEVKLRKMDKFL